MNPERLTTQNHWATLYQKAAGSARRSRPGDILKNCVPERLRLLRKRLTQRHWSRQLAEVILRPHLEGRSGLKGLEIGSAPGYRSLALWRRFGLEPHGLEYTEEGARAQRALYRENGLPAEWVVQGDFFDDALRAPWAGAFDLVVSYGFIEHFGQPGDVARKHLDLVKPGGLLVLTVPNMNEHTVYGRLARRFNPAVYAMHNARTCSLAGLRDLAQPLGGEILHCGTLGGCDFEFDAGPGRTGRWLAAFLRQVNPLINVLNHLWPGMRLKAFPRTSSTLALVVRKS